MVFTYPFFYTSVKVQTRHFLIIWLASSHFYSMNLWKHYCKNFYVRRELLLQRKISFKVQTFFLKSHGVSLKGWVMGQNGTKFNGVLYIFMYITDKEYVNELRIKFNIWIPIRTIASVYTFLSAPIHVFLPCTAPWLMRHTCTLYICFSINNYVGTEVRLQGSATSWLLYMAINAFMFIEYFYQSNCCSRGVFSHLVCIVRSLVLF